MRREGDAWCISFAGRSIRPRDMKELHYLAALLLIPVERSRIWLRRSGEATSASTRPTRGVRAAEWSDEPGILGGWHQDISHRML